jgi:CBS domain-containing protein
MNASPTQVRDVMTSSVITIAPSAKFPEVVDTMLTHDVSGLPVVDEAGRLLGMVTEADLISKEAYGVHRRRPLGLIVDFLCERDPQWIRKASGRTASELMTAAPTIAAPDDDVNVAAQRMLESHHKHLPVVDSGKLVGIVSRHDLLKPFHRTDADISAEIAELLADPMRVPETHQAQAFVNGGVVTLVGDVMYPSDATLIGNVVARVPGVVAVENLCRPGQPDPSVSYT